MQRLAMGIVGAGKVGSVLAARFRSAGYPIVGVSGRSDASTLRISTLLPGIEVRTPVELAEASEILILAVPDDNLIAVAEELASSGAIHPGSTSCTRAVATASTRWRR
ncbi:NAD(P)-binding domain-containing protein [Aeromicrobium sp. UC242_57]|uniref:NAD(P)-binding domain-containing protein n=1 Tax=Aeromicrobium sp. UC242_57 TaxID=3374624 RepID=UPI0037A4917B